MRRVKICMNATKPLETRYWALFCLSLWIRLTCMAALIELVSAQFWSFWCHFGKKIKYERMSVCHRLPPALSDISLIVLSHPIIINLLLFNRNKHFWFKLSDFRDQWKDLIQLLKQQSKKDMHLLVGVLGQLLYHQLVFLLPGNCV